MSKIVRFTSAVASLCLAALPVVAVATGAHAAPAAVTIKVSDLNLARADHAALFQSRLNVATRAFCDGDVGSQAIAVRRACRDAVAEEAMAKLSDHQRQSLHTGMAGNLVTAAR